MLYVTLLRAGTGSFLLGALGRLFGDLCVCRVCVVRVSVGVLCVFTGVQFFNMHVWCVSVCGASLEVSILSVAFLAVPFIPNIGCPVPMEVKLKLEPNRVKSFYFTHRNNFLCVFGKVGLASPTPKWLFERNLENRRTNFYLSFSMVLIKCAPALNGCIQDISMQVYISFFEEKKLNTHIGTSFFVPGIAF